MKQSTVIFESGDHKWIALHGDRSKPEHLIDTNEYIVTYKGKAMMTDPGGIEIFPSVLAEVRNNIEIENLEFIFASHQDPDVSSSSAFWLECKPDLKIYISRLWTTFMPHLGSENQPYQAISDSGTILNIQGLELHAIPAHHLHSSGNLHLYDPVARIYFSGDIGAALLPPEIAYFKVTDFDDHLQYIKYFHQRWIGSAEHKNEWCDRVASMQIDKLCPQHGSIYEGENVNRFLQWLRDLKVGII